MSAPGDRRRRLRLVLAVVGLLAAAFVAFLFLPAGGGNTSAFEGVLRFGTNDGSHIQAQLLVTNRGRRPGQMLRIETVVKREGAWTVFGPQNMYPPMKPVAPGDAVLIPIQFPNDSDAVRLEWSWFEEPSRLFTWQFKVRTKLNSLRPGSGGDLNKAVMSMVRTNKTEDHWRRAGKFE